MPKLNIPKKSDEKTATSGKCRTAAYFSDPIVYCLCAVALLSLTYVVSDIVIGLSVFQKIALNLIIFASLYVLGLIKAKNGERAFMRKMYFLMLLFYVYFLVSATLLDRSLGRDVLGNAASAMDRREYYKYWFVNLKPFHTVKTIYIDALKNGYLSLGYVIFNALGNFLILAPAAILIPAVSKRFAKPYFLFPILLLSTLAIEGLQYLFMRGSCDVDDVIFNFVGAAAIRLIVMIPPIGSLVDKIMLTDRS